MSYCPHCGLKYEGLSFVCRGCHFPFEEEGLWTKGCYDNNGPAVPVHSVVKKTVEVKDDGFGETETGLDGRGVPSGKTERR